MNVRLIGCTSAVMLFKLRRHLCKGSINAVQLRKCAKKEADNLVHVCTVHEGFL